MPCPSLAPHPCSHPCAGFRDSRLSHRGRTSVGWSYWWGGGANSKRFAPHILVHDDDASTLHYIYSKGLRQAQISLVGVTPPYRTVSYETMRYLDGNRELSQTSLRNSLRNIVDVKTRIHHENTTYTGELTKLHGSSCSMSIAASIIQYIL